MSSKPHAINVKALTGGFASMSGKALAAGFAFIAHHAPSFALQLTLPFLLLSASATAIHAQDPTEKYPNTQQESIPFTPPEKALAAMEMPEGFQATLFAHEPDVHQPIAMTFDAKGRLWVVENYTYSDRKQNFNNELHDRVLIFADEDNDGKFDKRKIFWDKGNKLTGIEIGRGGVWLTAAPELIFIPDADRDDVPDGPPQVVLDGFDDDVVRHNLVNGLRWGPDGWLYSRHGIQATSHVGKPGSPISKRTPMNCCIWRYHPQRETVEVVAEGGTNPWGFDFDQHGEMFMINTVIGHLFHIVPGARYNRMYGSHLNPYTWQTIEQTADHLHWSTDEKWNDTKKGAIGDSGRGSDATSKAGGGHAHSGLMIYQGDNWPDEYRGRLFTLNFHGRRMNQEILVRDGNSFVGQHGTDMFQTADPWFRGVELTYGPDGAVYVLDWSDIGECHENDGIHRTSGRIFKIAYGTPKKPAFDDLCQLSNDDLVGLLGHKNAWYPRMAMRILHDRVFKEPQGIVLDFKSLRKMAAGEEESNSQRINAMWALVCFFRPDKDMLFKSLDQSDEHVRAAAVRMMTHRRLSFGSVANTIVTLANDPSPLVRLYVASVINRLPTSHSFEAARRLVAFETDMQDRVQPKLIWHRIEPFIAGDFEQSMTLFNASKSQQLRLNIVRRLACDPQQQDEMLEQLVQRLLTDEQPYPADLLHGIQLAIEGRRQMKAPPSWAKLAAKVGELDADSAKRFDEISPVFGDGRSLDRLMKVANDREADTGARRQAILSLAQFSNPKQLFPLLKRQIRDRTLGAAIVKAMASCNQDEVPKLVLKQYRRLSNEGRQNAVDTLCGRKKWAGELLAAIEGGKVDASAITAWHARQIQSFEDDSLTNQLTKVWGKVRETDKDRAAQIDQLRTLLTEAAPAKNDVKVGAKLFAAHCASCHALFGNGGNIGPDLTGANRQNLNYLLENIVDPSASVATSFRTSVLLMEDGRVLTGVVLDNNGQTLKLQTQQERLTLEVAAVDEIKQTELSMMPEKLLDALSDAEKVALFRYLMSN